RAQDDGSIGLACRADRDPAKSAVPDVLSDLETEGVPVEGNRRVRVVLGKEARVYYDVHAGHSRACTVAIASRFLTGFVTCFATQDGMPSVARAASIR